MNDSKGMVTMSNYIYFFCCWIYRVGWGLGRYKDGKYICESPLSVRTYNSKFHIASIICSRETYFCNDDKLCKIVLDSFLCKPFLFQEKCLKLRVDYVMLYRIGLHLNTAAVSCIRTNTATEFL